MNHIQRFLVTGCLFLIIVMIETIIFTPNINDTNYTSEALFSQSVLWLTAGILVYFGCKPLLIKPLNTKGF